MAILIGGIVGLMIGTIVGAVLLRAAIALYNKLAGGAESGNAVMEPDFGKSMGITFVTALVNFMVSLCLTVILSAAANGPTRTGAFGSLLAQLISFPVSLLIMAVMLTGMLPTKFSRAILVTLCYLLVCILVGGILFVVFYFSMR